jgi:GntR family transcriptional regulator / MocR family aminotransferase
MNDFIVEGHFARHLRKMRTLYAERQLALLSALKREFGNHLPTSNINTGMDLVAWLPPAVLDTSACELASERGVITMPMSAFYCTPPARSGLFLGFGAISETQIAEGVKKLRVALDTLLILEHNGSRSG